MDKFNDIDFEKLLNQFVLKCTHDSGGLIICKNKSKLDVENARKIINSCMKKNYFWHSREWPYKNIKARIIAEKYMVDESGYELKDYKFFCFSGICKFMYIVTDRHYNTKFDFFDKNFVHLPFTNGHPNTEKKLQKPKNYDIMINLAEKLSNDIPQVRIDFYNINGKIYFEEITFFHLGGFTPFGPEEWDEKIGNYIKLPINKKIYTFKRTK